MSLAQLLDIADGASKKQGMSEERLAAQIQPLRRLISFYREYPDLLVDFMVWGTHAPTQEMKEDPNNKNKFKFYFYQRIK